MRHAGIFFLLIVILVLSLHSVIVSLATYPSPTTNTRYHAKQDPVYENIAVETSIEFMKSHMHTMYELATNKSIQPIVEDKTGKTWYACLTDDPTYRISWRIPVKSKMFGDATYMFEVGFTIIVDNGVGKIKSVSLMGSIRETPEII
jgi:hypothetical protein